MSLGLFQCCENRVVWFRESCANVRGSVLDGAAYGSDADENQSV